MKIFIAGARSVTLLDSKIVGKLSSILKDNHDILIGDASGADSLVQKFYADKKYKNVTVYANNGEARNNFGKWHIENIIAERKLKGFEYYKQKDIAMANAADFGLMIWDGKSRGTLNNIKNLLQQGKECAVYLVLQKRFINVNDEKKLIQLLGLCPAETTLVYNKIAKIKTDNFSQIALF